VFNSILCPVDFSEHSKRALALAIDVASLARSHLTVVHVVDPLLEAAAVASGAGASLTAQTQEELKTLLQQIAPGRHEPIGIAVEVGEPAERILAQVAECSSDLIVMGTQGLEGPRRLVFGSTTEQVLRESRIPVLAVPAPNAE
jgi:nucleotide-binding universal stress UspA family protein